MTDRTLITKALKLWFQPGDVFEIRALDATTTDYRRPHVESGYFDYEHIAIAAREVAKLCSYAGVYVTINPVNPDLLARACNRMKYGGKTPLTSDGDIIRRRWLLIDCDAVRPSGISSTDEEHEAALAKAREIRDYLTSLGWPEPIMLDSGNGAQMTYRIDLPSDDGGLVSRVLSALSVMSNDQVKLDVTVCNPARIWRLPGTMNCKGDSTETRPHRPARLAAVPAQPESISLVTTEQLLQLADTAGFDRAGVVSNDSTLADKVGSMAADTVSWVRKYCPELGEPKPWKDGRKWVFDVCPFNPDHHDRSAVLIQEPSGAMCFKCHHNGCAENDWRKLRKLKEAGMGYNNITTSGDCDSGSASIEADRIGMEADTVSLSVPGFINDVIDVSMATAPYPNRVLAFTGALALLAFLVGRKFCDRRDNRSNLYLMALADPGTGKDYPRKVNFDIAYQVGLGGSIADTFASGEGLEDALAMYPSMLFQADEVDGLFNVMRFKDSRAESINEKLLKFYSASNTIYPLRKRALARNQRDGNVSTIINPNLVLYGTAVPRYFYEALSRRVLENGLTARCLVIEAWKRGVAGDPKPIAIPESVLARAKYLRDVGSRDGNLATEFPKPIVVEEDPEATEQLMDTRDAFDARIEFYGLRNEMTARMLWCRAFEKVCKLAMLHGISGDVYHPRITVQSVKWARQLVEHLTERMLFMADNYVYENPFDEKCKKVVRILRGTGGISRHGVLLRTCREPSDEFKRIITTLEENGTLHRYLERTKTKTAIVYKLL
jgi:hypothetical protein